MEMKLQFKLSQQLVMTPQLVQAIRLLQLSRMELIDEVRKELDGNPVLADDFVDPRARKELDKTLPSTAAKDAPPEERIGVTERVERDDAATREVEKQVKEVDWEQFLENRLLQAPAPGGGRGGFEELPPIEQSLTRPVSLREHLLKQLGVSDFVDSEKRFAALVIGNLDDRGYLDLEGGEGPDGERRPDLTLEDLAREAGLDPEDAEEVHELIKRLDPIGVGSRDLRECLLVQGEVLGFDEVEIAIVRDHLHNVERRNFNAIAKALKVELEEIYEAVQEIQKLESIPARNFTDVDDKQIAITPDVYVIRDGVKWVVTDNDKGLQRLYINTALAERMQKDPKAKEFINDKLKSAKWFINAIDQRRRTIIKVTECIVEKQREFLEKGVAYLKPMILRDVATTVGMHESTISRVTSNKYVHTPQGIFELKYFFNSSISRVADEDIASESVKQAIKKIIAQEDKSNPLSDQAIVQLLEEQDGIQIARRTVAKYREMLGILSSTKRKKMF
jgi:RNA polymerase sigma-54 factor